MLQLAEQEKIAGELQTSLEQKDERINGMQRKIEVGDLVKRENKKLLVSLNLKKGSRIESQFTGTCFILNGLCHGF